MTTRVGINGFGRIGRLAFRAALETPEVEVVAVNDLTDTRTLAHLLKYDSVHGPLPHVIEATETAIALNGRQIRVTRNPDPKTIGWKEVDAHVVIESTGRFAKREAAAGHLAAGALKVVISAPADDADATFVVGVNEDGYDPARHHVVSNASCTTNCLAPVADVLDRALGIIHGLMTTVHAYTNDQVILDFVHKDLRRARAAGMSLIPTKTGAAAAIGLVLPRLKGKLDGLAVRVPTPNVSLVDLTVRTEKSATREGINAAFKAAADQGRLKGILGYSDLPLVSIDFNHCPFSAVVDGPSTKVIDENFLKVLAWYDNEWAYSRRLIDLARLIGARLD